MKLFGENKRDRAPTVRDSKGKRKQKEHSPIHKKMDATCFVEWEGFGLTNFAELNPKPLLFPLKSTNYLSTYS